jgi:hypothetical protein
LKRRIDLSETRHRARTSFLPRLCENALSELVRAL